MDHIAPKKSLGQNFLVDRNIAGKIIEAFNATADDTVVEIGPGEGALTHGLVETAGTVIAIDLDPMAVVKIREKFGDAVTVLEGDVLKLDFGALARDIGVATFRVIGNIPYYITSPILFHLIQYRHCISDAMLMMQKEVAERLVATPRTKEYGILAVAIQTYSEPQRIFNVGPKCFHPQPKVTSSIVHIRFRDMEGVAGIEKEHRSILRGAFSQRRKTLRNALSQLIPDQEQRAAIFLESGIRPEQRAEELAPADFVRLASIFAASRKGDVRG